MQYFKDGHNEVPEPLAALETETENNTHILKNYGLMLCVE